MTGIYVSIALGCAALILFMIKCNKQRSVGGVFNKNIVSIFFIAVAFFGTFKALGDDNHSMIQYGLCLMFGLVFGMLGDIYLDQKWVYPDDEKKYLYAGFITFLIGHCFYIFAIFRKFSEFVKLEAKHFLIAAAVAAVVDIGNLILEKPTKQHYGSYKAIVSVYTFFVAGTLGASLTAAIFTHGTEGFVPFLVYAIGALLFLVSDIILSPMYFGDGSKNTPVNFVINHLTYYIGQYMFAFTIVLFK